MLVSGAVAPLDPSAESSISLPGLRRNLLPKWSNGWAWEGAPYKAKIFLNVSLLLPHTARPHTQDLGLEEPPPENIWNILTWFKFKALYFLNHLIGYCCCEERSHSLPD